MRDEPAGARKCFIDAPSRQSSLLCVSTFAMSASELFLSASNSSVDIPALLCHESAIMRNHHALFLCVFLFSCTNGETVKLARPSDPYPSIPLSNSTVGLSGDSRFALQPHYTSTRLSATAVLMSVIFFLAEAANYGFESFLDINRRASFPAYSSVVIDIQTVKSKDRLQNFLVIWGLYESAWDMVSRSRSLSFPFYHVVES